MDRDTTREIVATLLKQGRRDLARQFTGAAMKPVDMLRFEEALSRAVFDTAKKQKLKLNPKAKQQLSYIVKKWVDTVDSMLA
jgi:hypothetical protein